MFEKVFHPSGFSSLFYRYSREQIKNNDDENNRDFNESNKLLQKSDELH